MNILADEDENWQKLSVWSVLHFIASLLKQLGGNLIAIIPLIYGISSLDDPLLVAAVVSALIILMITYAILQYVYFSYQVTDDSVLVRKGVLFKKQINLGFERIQNVSFKHPFYFRPLELVTVKIDSAGSSGDEVYLSALDGPHAQLIHDQIAAAKLVLGQFSEENSESVTEFPAKNTSENLQRFLIDRSLLDLVIHGLTNNRAWIILGAVGAAYGQFKEQLHTFTADLGFDVSGFLSDQTIPVVALLLLSAFFLSLILVALLSVVGSIFSYYNYKLYDTDDAFTVNRGLLTRHEIHIQKSRIQSVYFRQDWLDRVLGRVNLIFEQLSHKTQGLDDVKLLVPTVTPFEALRLTREVMLLPDLESLSFTGISKRYWFRNLALWGLLYLPAILLGIGSENAVWIAPAVFVFYLLHAGLLYRSWKCKGIAIDADAVVVRQGIFGIDYLVIPAHKLQRAKYIQSPMMKRHSLASLQLTVASRSVEVPFLDSALVCQVIDYTLYQAESSNRSWM
ncbi:MAG: putative membrane protein [Candidatus Azotimanducaceae bacterium]